MDKKMNMPEQKNGHSHIDIKEDVEYKTECRNKHNCLEAIRHILDGEATEEEIAHFKQNMDKCLPCIENYNLELSIKQVLCDKIEKKCVPPGLTESIKNQINKV